VIEPARTPATPTQTPTHTGALVALAASVLCALAVVTSGAADGQTRPAGGARAGGARSTMPAACGLLRVPDDGGHFIAAEDFTPPVPVVDGDDLLALVNRSPRWVLASSYAPTDMVDLVTGRPTPASLCVPPDRLCLRREAARAYTLMAAAMRAAGHAPKVDSTFRGYGTQCAVFAKWAWRRGTAMGFCPATNASAIPGHSQHQLGTAMDLFTLQWVRGGAHFREGFGCSPGGRWIEENSWRFGFVLPYPLHPDYRAAGSDCAARPEDRGRVDPRTGYKHEPWHIRYIGVENAERFHRAWEASGPGTSAEITLEQWLRERLGARDPVEPPVCDGCVCGECASFASGGGPCPAEQSWALDRGGHPVGPRAIPAIVSVRAAREGSSVVVRAVVRVSAQTPTQPPLGDSQGIVSYPRGVTARSLSTREGALPRDYRAIEGAWRVGVELREERSGRGFPWRVALVTGGRDTTANGFNARALATTGDVDVGVRIEGVRPGQRLRVGLLRGDEAVDASDLRAP
jgi:D-alanyl-D-alanine carboxypeptidase